MPDRMKIRIIGRAMSKKSKIEWTDQTWNPTIGCSMVSSGCKNCYAMRMAHRLASNPSLNGQYEGLTKISETGPRWTGEVRIIAKRLGQPLRWRRPRLVFVNSMSDLFHSQLSFDYIAAVFAIMAATPEHTYQVLTKRPLVMSNWFHEMSKSSSCKERILASLLNFDSKAAEEVAQQLLFQDSFEWPLKNVWLGVSVESREMLYRVDVLREIPAHLRFISCEPLLGSIKNFGLEGIGWVIVGGETGPRARKMEPLWVHEIKTKCQDETVPFFFKQWGGGRKKNRILDGKIWEGFPT